MRRALLVVVVLLIAGAYLVGFWPGHRQALALQAELRATQTQLADADARVRVGQVLGQALELSDAVSARDYGRSASLSSAFFDRVRAETATGQGADVQQALNQILATRDAVTTALTRSDPAVLTILIEHQKRLRQVLGYPTGATAS